MEHIELSEVIPCSPARLYRAWLDSGEHSAFTGSEAKVDPRVGGRFSAWAQYITGETLELEPSRRIVQAWRTVDFPPGSPDSRLEILLEAAGAATRVTLKHSNLPDGQGEEYRQGWIDNYFDPMKTYFSSPKGQGKGRAAAKRGQHRRSANRLKRT